MESKITKELLSELYEKDAVYMTQHVITRCRNRGITPKQIRLVLTRGEVIEDYPNDYPWPSCLMLGYPLPDKALHVVVCTSGDAAKIITAYYPDPDLWGSDMKTRKEPEK